MALKTGKIWETVSTKDMIVPLSTPFMVNFLFQGNKLTDDPDTKTFKLDLF